MKTLLSAAALVACSAGAFAAMRQDPKPEPAPTPVVRGDDPVQNPADKKKGDEKVDKVTVWVLEATASGWSASKRARAAMQDVEGMDKMLLSGTTATFTFEKDAKVDAKALQAQLEKACKDNKVEFVSLTKKEVARAGAAYVAKTPGLTWAKSAGKVREALVEGFGKDVVQIFAGTEIVFHLKNKNDKFDEEKLKTLLKEHEVKLEKVSRDDTYVL